MGPHFAEEDELNPDTVVNNKEFFKLLWKFRPDEIKLDAAISNLCFDLH